MAIPTPQGVPVPVLMIREDVALGAMELGTAVTLIPDPARAENPAALRHDRKLREHAQLRSEVQRVLKGTAKGKNVSAYADYIAAGLTGSLGKAWSTPPLCLWSAKPLVITDGGKAIFPLGSPVVAIDAETQVAAMHAIMNDPESYGLNEDDLQRRLIPFEVYWGITTGDARQIFHDRNLLGVPVAKTLALSMDQRDFGTSLAQHVVLTTKVTFDGQPTSLASFVNNRKRQLGQRDSEWITLSALRSLAVTTLLGKPGIDATSSTITTETLPSGVSEKQALDEIGSALSNLIAQLQDAFASRSAITTPAVLAGLGAAVHRAMSWSTDPDRLSPERLTELVTQVNWQRESRYWDGVAAKITPRGTLSFAGGAKDSGHRVCDAILNPDSPLGQRIRGIGVTTTT